MGAETGVGAHGCEVSSRDGVGEGGGVSCLGSSGGSGVHARGNACRPGKSGGGYALGDARLLGHSSRGGDRTREGGVVVARAGSAQEGEG